MEFLRQWPLFKERWKTILAGAAFQYVHAIFTQLAHRMARPTAEPLHDLGFTLLPELGQNNEWVSETIFNTMLASFLIWTFSPFWQESGKRFYTAVLYARVLVVLVICQSLRILSFTVTTLPSPNYHCRTPRETAVAPWPEHWWGHVVVDLKKQTTHGCGDLIFSSHTTFALVGVMSYQEYGTLNSIKAVIWSAAAVLSFLIVASRKHYTVDVLVAWYVVPLVFYSSHRRWTTKRSLKEEWPHRPLPEEQPPELESVVVLTNAEVPVSKQASMLSSIQMQRVSSKDLMKAAGARDLGAKASGKDTSGEAYDNFPGNSSTLGDGRGASPSSTVMRPRSTNALADSGSGTWAEEDTNSHAARPPNSQIQSLLPSVPNCRVT